jgi:hypothetical protein
VSNVKLSLPCHKHQPACKQPMPAGAVEVHESDLRMGIRGSGKESGDSGTTRKSSVLCGFAVTMQLYFISF